MKDLTIKDFKSDNGRSISIDSEIDECSLADFKKELIDLISNDYKVFEENVSELKNINDEVAKSYEKSVKFPPIYIDICSVGGSLYHAFGMYDLLTKYSEDKKHTIIARTSGMVASAATIVMLGCKERISTKYTSFLVHSVSAFAIGKVNDILEEVDEIKRLQDIIVEIYTANTKLTKEKLEEIDKMKKDWWIGAKEAKSYGLITSIE